VSGTILGLSKTPTFLANKQRLEALKRTDHFAVREGRLTMNGWKLKQSAIGKVAAELTEHSDRLVVLAIDSLSI
jgi:hypothetical protein